MKSLDTNKHKTQLTNILLDIYKDSLLAPSLGFKGGTAAMLFYGLPRFSIDLDFDLTGFPKNGSKSYDEVVKKMSNLLSNKYEVKDQSQKFNTLFWLVDYGKSLSNIKVEISTMDCSYNHYEMVQFYGVNVKVLAIEDMIPHKMVAVMERTSIANRDLFDVNYFLSSKYAGEINYEVIKQRTGKEPYEFYTDLLKFVKDIDPKWILKGLGEVLNQSQKDWAKERLIPDLVGLIERQRDLFK